MLVEGSDLSVEIHKHSRRREMDSYERPPEEDPMGKASIKFNDLGKHLDSEIRIETKGERVSASITSHLLRAPQKTSRWNLIIRSKDYSCGSLSRCVVIIVVTPIHFPNSIAGSQH